jgi:hypothetical protein
MYDLETDPLEVENVYNNPEYQSVRDSLHRELIDLMNKYGDSDSLAFSLLP